MSSFLHIRNLKTHAIPQAKSIRSENSTFFKDDLGGHASSGASPAFLSDHEFLQWVSQGYSCT